MSERSETMTEAAASGVAAAGGEPEPDDRGSNPLGSPVARWSALVLFAALVIVGWATGVVGTWFTLLVLAPVVVAMAASEAALDSLSRWARVVAVIGLVVWLAVTGGLPMLLVVAMVVLMIFLHELGHYMAAKRAGMKVTEFFLGFGTKLWSFRRGETEFGLKAIPAGAYVKIIGMNNLEEVDPADEQRTYRQAPFHSRLSVAAAGSAMHFLLALVLLVVQFAAFGRADEQAWVVGDLTEGGAAQAAGIDSGDRIVAFDGAPVGTFDEFRDQIHSATGSVDVEVERDGETVAVPVDLVRRSKVIGTVGTDLDILETPDGVFVGPVLENSRIDRAGLATGAQVLAVNGEEVSDLDSVAAAVARSDGGELSVEVAGGSTVGAEVAEVDLGSELAMTEPTAFLGVGPESLLRRESIPASVGSAVGEFGRGVGASVTGIVSVFSPPRLWGFMSDTVTGTQQDVTDEPTPAEQVAVSTDAGRPTSIIGAVAYGADMTAENLSNLIGFMIGLNIFIGVFNLIPLLPFDGGHVAIAVYEKCREVARRSKRRYIADVTKMIPVAYGVVMVLAVVGILAMYLDLTQGVSA